MEYTTLNNGVRMPLLGYGTWEVRGEEGCRCIRQALEVGYRLLDTAQMYGNEEMVGAGGAPERPAPGGDLPHHQALPPQRQL